MNRLKYRSPGQPWCNPYLQLRVSTILYVQFEKSLTWSSKLTMLYLPCRTRSQVTTRTIVAVKVVESVNSFTSSLAFSRTLESLAPVPY